MFESLKRTAKAPLQILHTWRLHRAARPRLPIRWVTEWHMRSSARGNPDAVSLTRYGYDAKGHPGFTEVYIKNGEVNDHQEFRRLVDERQMAELLSREGILRTKGR